MADRKMNDRKIENRFHQFAFCNLHFENVIFYFSFCNFTVLAQPRLCRLVRQRVELLGDNYYSAVLAHQFAGANPKDAAILQAFGLEERAVFRGEALVEFRVHCWSLRPVKSPRVTSSLASRP